MFKSFFDIFDTILNPKNDSGQPDGKHTIELAAAALMFEISQADNTIQQEEREIIHKAIRTEFDLTEEEVNSLMECAEKEVDDAVSLTDFTRVINQKMSPQERKRVLELLWQVAYADKIIDKYEEYFIRKIADLLHIAHKDYIRAKHKAADSLV